MSLPPSERIALTKRIGEALQQQSDELVNLAEEAGRENRQVEEGLWLEPGPNYNKPIPEVLSDHLDALLGRSPAPDLSDFQSASTGPREDDISF